LATIARMRLRAHLVLIVTERVCDESPSSEQTTMAL